MWTKVLFLLFAGFFLPELFQPVASQVTFLDHPIFRPFFRLFRNITLDISKHPSDEIAHRKNLKKGVSSLSSFEYSKKTQLILLLFH
jgi:hypothetical protein